MTRVSKQQERRARSPRKHKKPFTKTGPLKDNLPAGYKTHSNAAEGLGMNKVFIPKVK